MGLYKRDMVWWMTFSFKGDQIRRSTETTDKRLAEKIYAKVLTQITEGKWFTVDEGRMRTFLELVDKYESTEFKELKGWRSVQSYLKGLKEFFGPYKLSEITAAHIDEFKQKRKAEGVMAATIVRQLNIFKRMFNLAKKRWMWVKDVPPIEMESKADIKRLRYLSFEDYHKLLNCCDGWLKNVVTVAAWTGLRQGDILNLKWEQVNLFARTISIDGSETKNGENLTIPVAEAAFEVLKEAKRIVQLKSPYIFCKTDGSLYGKMNVQRAFKKALKKADIEDFRFHDLRHCFASWNRQAGVDLDTLADLMGHRDTRMTRRYAHIGPVHLANAVGLLDKSYHNFITVKEKGATAVP